MAIGQGERLVFPKSSTRILPKEPGQKEKYLNKIKASGKEFEIRNFGIRYFTLKRNSQKPLKEYLEEKKFQDFSFPLSDYPEEIKNNVQTDIMWGKTKYYAH